MTEPSRTDIAGQAQIARRALEMKSEGDKPSHPDAGRTAGEGMQVKEGSTGAVSGALDAEGHRPVLERSRKAR